MRANEMARRFVCVGATVALCMLLAVAVPACRQKAEEPTDEQQETVVESSEQKEQVVAEPTAAVFDMEEFSVFEYEGPLTGQLWMGQYVRECGYKPSEKVKAYPAFKSDKPIYGTAKFDMSLVPYGKGIDYCFAIDECKGTDTGYDRFYFDTNHDFDLTNDAAVAPMEKLPRPLAGQNRSDGQNVFFGYLQFSIDYGPDKASWPVKIIPQLRQFAASNRVSFIVPTARRGKIKLGSKEYEAVLSQASMLTGRYDRPTVYLYLGSDMESMPLLCGWRYVDGTFYILSPTPAGDKLTVTPYTGPFGVLEVAANGADATEGKVELGWLVSKDAIIDVGKCPREDGRPKVPVGDYKPFRLAIRRGELRVGFALNTQQLDEAPAEPPVFAIRVREGRPYVFDFSGEPEVVFKSPAAGERFKAGGQLKVEAFIYDPDMDVLIAGLEDTTRKLGDPIKLPDGTDYQRYQSLDPVVKITDSAGECVAEGKMPFG